MRKKFSLVFIQATIWRLLMLERPYSFGCFCSFRYHQSLNYLPMVIQIMIIWLFVITFMKAEESSCCSISWNVYDSLFNFPAVRTMWRRLKLGVEEVAWSSKRMKMAKSQVHYYNTWESHIWCCVFQVNVELVQAILSCLESKGPKCCRYVLWSVILCMD